MRDSAIVISVRDELAWVKVVSRVPCCDCSARALCAGMQDGEGRIQARNPVHAQPGDEVELDVPETNYHRDLIRIFGLLLLAVLAGLGLGSALKPFGGLSTAENGLAGLLAALILSGFAIYRYYRARSNRAAYPVITDITDKGGHHG
jgi:positive regulator of sigma E activity